MEDGCKKLDEKERICVYKMKIPCCVENMSTRLKVAVQHALDYLIGPHRPTSASSTRSLADVHGDVVMCCAPLLSLRAPLLRFFFIILHTI